MKCKVRWLVIAVAVACGLFQPLKAQDLPGKKDSVNSVILGQKRYIQVVLPQKSNPAKKYDVLYVLDGDGNTKLASDVQRFLEDEAYMPPIIIVGVLNIDRNHDLTPVHIDENKTSGGGDKFLDFLKDELIPYINKTYPSDGENTIFGHSLGGLFVMYALLNEPQTFASCIAADPSFWYNHNYMNKMAADKLPGLVNMHKTLYISGREGANYRGMGIVGMDSILKKYAPADLNWKAQPYPDETHGSVRLKSMYDGLKFTYGGYINAAVVFHPMNGIMLKDKPAPVWVISDYTSVRYTTDGTTPTLNSPKWADEVSITGPAKLRVKSFTNREAYDKTTNGEFKLGETLPPLAKPGKFKPGGFSYTYYEGQFDKLPDFKKLKPVQTGITDKNFDLDKLPRKDNFALLIEGELEIKQDGYYIFGLDSDDGSRVFLNHQLLIDYDGLHAAGTIQSYMVPLAKGFYPIRLEYFQKDGGRNLQLIYVLPGSKQPHAVPIPLELQYSKE
jgi:predicted alpha/beta superfamily hydrolase